MADRRPKVDDPRHFKRQKIEDSDSKADPYMTHKYDPTAKPFLPRKSEIPTGVSSNKNGDGKPNKMKAEHMDPKANPYLAHMYEDSAEDSTYSNGYGKPHRTGNSSALANFPLHGTNAAMAKEAEDGPNNPFSEKPLSPQYFNILKARRNLPIHAQR